MKGGKLLYWLSNYQPFKYVSVPMDVLLSMPGTGCRSKQITKTLDGGIPSNGK
jgi:hypothetical protein